MTVLSKISSFMMSVVLAVTYILGMGTVSNSEGYELIRSEKLVMLDALKCGQGMCTDGEYIYSSSAITAINLTVLAKWDMDMNPIDKNIMAVPSQLTKTYGSNHIGGIDCFNGVIYAPVEAPDCKRNFIVLYDCETLDYTGKYYDVSCDMLTDGIPWCAVDGENGYLYTSKFSGVTEILRFKLSDMSFDGSVKLDTKIDRIQGGSVYNGKLYLSIDVAHSVNDRVLTVDIESGTVRLELERYLCNYDNEAEDIFVYPFEDGSLVHVMDYDKLVGTNIYHYKPIG